MSYLYGQSNPYRGHSPAPPPAYSSGPPPGRHSSTSSYSGRHYQQAPPPGGDPQLWQWFSAVDIDKSGSISADELQKALVNGECSWLKTYAKADLFIYLENSKFH